MKELYEKAGIIKNGHFKLSSGRHSNMYVNKDAIYASELFEKTIERMWCLSIDKFEDKFDVVTGPAVAGAVLAAPVSFALNHYYGMDCRFVYPEKVELDEHTVMQFNRGYDKIIEGHKVLIIEDIITTGSSVIKTARSIRDCGGTVAGCVCIWNRSGWSTEAFPVHTMVADIVESFEPEDYCPLCELNVSLTNPKTGEEVRCQKNH